MTVATRKIRGTSFTFALMYGSNFDVRDATRPRSARYIYLSPRTVASALEGCSVWTATREKDDELELTALREMESKETSVISRSSELLREIE